MEVTVGPLGVKFKPQEIYDILHQLSSYFNRDKNSICLALALIKRNIMDWENEINSVVLDQMSNHLSKKGKLPKKDIHAIFSITEYPLRRDVGAESLLQLKNIENDLQTKREHIRSKKSDLF